MVLPYMRELQIDYPVLLAEQRSDVLDAFGVHQGLPTTVIISRDGTTCQRRVGFTRKERFEQIIRALL